MPVEGITEIGASEKKKQQKTKNKKKNKKKKERKEKKKKKKRRNEKTSFFSDSEPRSFACQVDSLQLQHVNKFKYLIYSGREKGRKGKKSIH